MYTVFALHHPSEQHHNQLVLFSPIVFYSGSLMSVNFKQSAAFTYYILTIQFKQIIR